MSEISKNIMEQIKDGAIKPRPRWQFVLMNVFLIVTLVLAIVAGGVVMSLVFLKLFNLDWDLVSLSGEKGPSIFGVLPFIWILLLMLMLLLSVWVFEQMEGGYRYRPVWLMVGAILLSVLLGGVVYVVKGADFIEDALRLAIPPYQEMEKAREILFLNPERGALPGKIVQLALPQGFELEDLRDDVWNVTLAPGLAGAPLVRGLKEGQMVMVIGVKTDDDQFVAQEVRVRKAFGGKSMKPVLLKHVRKIEAEL